MAITCPHCGAEYDVTLFAFRRTVVCTCGETVDATRPMEHRLSRAPAPRTESPEVRELRRRADGITWALLYSDVPRVDLEIQIEGLRSWVEDHLPDRAALFEMVYVARWRRLAEQGWEHGRPDV